MIELSDKDKETLKLLCTRYDASEIASALSISEGGLTQRFTSIYCKIGIDGYKNKAKRHMACLHAVKYGVVDINDVDI